ncbi:MAG: response regulator, partial [Acidobacteriota bacterium]
VVEDEPTVRRLLCGILQKYGYRVLEATDAEEAFALFRRSPEPIDLLLTDVIMPEVDGRAVAEQLVSEQPDLKVLYVSGYPDDFLGDRGILPETTNFLSKPFTPKTLISKVRTVLDEKPV